jgi:hypothetical protein
MTIYVKDSNNKRFNIRIDKATFIKDEYGDVIRTYKYFVNYCNLDSNNYFDFTGLLGRYESEYSGEVEIQLMLVATSDMVYRTDTPYTSDKQYDDEETGEREPWHILESFDDKSSNKPFALPTGRVSILECMLGEKYISNGGDEYTSEMVFWTIHYMDIIQQRVDIDNNN